jgi:phosphocarrier protein HPr
MIQREIIVRNQLGIHARPAALIVQTTGQFDADVWLEKDGVKANAKSIMSVMMLAASFETRILAKASGKDEQKAIDALVSLFESKFREES